FLPAHWLPYKLEAEFIILIFLMLLNMRGVKESVIFLAPIFVLFIVTHFFMILYAICSHLGGLPLVFHEATSDLHASVSSLGFAPVLFILLRAYSMGGGTY